MCHKQSHLQLEQRLGRVSGQVCDRRARHEVQQRQQQPGGVAQDVVRLAATWNGALSVSLHLIGLIAISLSS